MRLTRDRSVIPALMFHSVGLESHPWIWSHISESVDSFEAKLAAIVRAGFEGIFWGELYDHLRRKRALDGDAILLTFDDGYLDNWVFVFPLLKKYGLKGTIFITPEFVDPQTDPRPNLDDVWAGRCRLDELSAAGFLSWAELREMERSGLIDVQSHGLSHTWYFSGPRIVDFHVPAVVLPHPWLMWNAKPERKPFYLTEDQSGFVPDGHPIFEHEKALVVRRFFPDQHCMDGFISYLKGLGRESRFKHTVLREQLGNYIHNVCGTKSFPGVYETIDERTTRITEELVRSKEIIESELKKRVDFVCWPGGGYDNTVLNIARTVGFKAWTLGSKDQSEARNRVGTDPECIKRMGTDNQVRIRGRSFGTGGATFQVWRIFAHQNSSIYSAAVKVRKLMAVMGM